MWCLVQIRFINKSFGKTKLKKGTGKKNKKIKMQDRMAHHTYYIVGNIFVNSHVMSYVQCSRKYAGRNMAKNDST